MPERTKTGLFAGAILVMAVTLLTLVFTSPTPTDRVEAIGDRIKCPVCQGESISNSPAPMARDMMSLVSERVSSGMSDEEIIAELLASYSGAVLLDPPASGSTLALWMAPLAALLVGGAVIFWWMRHPPAESPGAYPTGRRPVVGWIVFAAALAAIVVVAGFSIQERTGNASGVAALVPDDVDQVSNETLEAVIAANLDHPQINGMRLALARRYVTEADYGAAIEHYLAVAESPTASDEQQVVALVQMGRLVWDGNAEADLAIGLFDRALELDPGSAPALYHKAIVTWCGLGDAGGASELLATVVEVGAPAELVQAAREDLSAIENGEACS